MNVGFQLEAVCNRVTKFFTSVETEPEGADITSCLASAPRELLTGFMDIHLPPF